MDWEIDSRCGGGRGPWGNGERKCGMESANGEWRERTGNGESEWEKERANGGDERAEGEWRARPGNGPSVSGNGLTEGIVPSKGAVRRSNYM